MSEDGPGRRFGFRTGRTERTERFIRRTYPDGTTVDSEPFEVAVSAPPSWSGIAAMFAKIREPAGTTREIYTRTVVIEAGPWIRSEVPAPPPDPADEIEERVELP